MDIFGSYSVYLIKYLSIYLTIDLLCYIANKMKKL